MPRPTCVTVSRQGLANWIALCPDIKGFGEKKAEQFVELLSSCGEWPDCLSAASNGSRPDKLDAGIVQTLKSRFDSNANRLAIEIWLAGAGLTWKKLQRLATEIHPNNLLADPYYAIHLSGFGWKTVDDTALKLGVPHNDSRRILAALRYYMRSEVAESGDTWVLREDLVIAVQKMLKGNDAQQPEPDEISAAISKLQDDKNVVAVGERGVGSAVWIRTERLIAEALLRAVGPNPHFNQQAVTEAQRRQSWRTTLNPDQRTAARMALEHRVVVITGGAGTGKTFVLSEIKKAYESRGMFVQLAAPTGKAARRIENVARCRAKTLHRLLQIDAQAVEEGKYTCPEIKAEALVVDEVSMVDLQVMTYLVDALDANPKLCLVLIGDPYQLPPVGIGSVLADLVTSNALPTIKLNDVIRQGSSLRFYCNCLLTEGKIPVKTDPKVWWVHENLEKPEEVIAVLVDLYAHRIPAKHGKDAFADIVQVLAPQQTGPLGVDAINDRLQMEAQKSLWGKTLPKPGGFHLHDRVIVTKNDYRRGVMNGQQGTVVEIGSKTLTVAFDRRLVELPRNYKSLRHGYAITVHKSQGSEWPIVIVVAHSCNSFMLDRGLMYTAVTRARELVVILGDRSGIHYAASKKQPHRRRTMLAEFLQKRGEQ